MDRNALVVLGLLREGPKHGYQVVSDVRERELDRWAGVSPASIYGVISRLQREGLIRESGRERAGNKPERIVFELTPGGESALAELVADALRSEAHTVDDSTLGVSFVYGAPLERVIESLRARRELLRATIYEEKHKMATYAGPVPFNWKLIWEGIVKQIELSLEQLAALIAWAEALESWEEGYAEFAEERDA